MKFSTRAAALTAALMIFSSSFSMKAHADDNGLVYGIGFVNATGLNLRQSPDTGSQVLTTANSGECIVVLGSENGWYEVSYNLQIGYMSADYINVATAENAELGYGVVTGSGVNLRSGPDTSYNRVATASQGEKCYIIGVNNGWYKVLYSNQTCYIRSDFLSLTEVPYENQASTSQPKYFRQGKAIGTVPTGSTSLSSSVTSSYNGTATGAEILSKAQSYLGTPYVYGGASPSGFDCSGFVYYVYGTFGISVGRTPAAQASAGTQVDKASLQVGDIVLFAGTAGSGITHAGIYAGNGQFIHSPNSRSTVSYSDLNSGYWSEHFYCGIRVV
jgi:NLP/P60 protein